MKKIYALIAVAAAGVMTASAFNGKAFDGTKAEPSRILPASEIANLKAPQINEAKKTTLKGFSRAEGEGTQITPALISSFNQSMYYLYANNWYDENGEQVEEFRGIRNSDLTVFEASEDMQTIYMKSYLGIECPGNGVELVWNAETKQYDMDLDQVFYVSSTYGDVKFGVIENKEIVSTGKVSFDLYSNGLVLDYDGWLFSAFPYQGKTYYFSDLTCADFMVLQPNYNLSYNYYDKDGNVSTLNKDVYFEEVNADPSNPNDLGGYMISNVMPFDGAVVTYFYNVELTNGDIIIIYDSESPVSDSQYVSQTEKSGDWFMFSYSESLNSYAKDVFAEFDINTKTFSWPVTPEVFAEDYVGFDQWFVESTNGYAYNIFQMADKATLTSLTNGIASAVIEEVEGPAEYYNLQGIKVANPAAGQIYIVKEGSKVSKRVF